MIIDVAELKKNGYYLSGYLLVQRNREISYIISPGSTEKVKIPISEIVQYRKVRIPESGIIIGGVYSIRHIEIRKNGLTI